MTWQLESHEGDDENGSETDDFEGRRRTPRKGHAHSGLEIGILGERDEATVLIGYYDYLGKRPKNSHRPIIVTGR